MLVGFLFLDFFGFCFFFGVDPIFCSFKWYMNQSRSQQEIDGTLKLGNLTRGRLASDSAAPKG